jgi:hypothetical protein
VRHRASGILGHGRFQQRLFTSNVGLASNVCFLSCLFLLPRSWGFAERRQLGAVILSRSISLIGRQVSQDRRADQSEYQPRQFAMPRRPDRLAAR